MRFVVSLAGLFVSSSALACGMYFPPEMKVASLGTLMGEIGTVEVVAATVEPERPALQGVLLDAVPLTATEKTEGTQTKKASSTTVVEPQS
ncbi:MAG: hypothetical protein KC656_15940 [Myxococcales bacterium]|nr:hypothetical protein [Myxococcales bacterium]